MTARSTIFRAGDIIRVPFPHVERQMMTVRPAFVVTSKAIGPNDSLIWTAMITNAARPAWPDDVFIDDWAALGLIIPSKIRTAKISTSEVATAVLLGHAPQNLRLTVESIIDRYLRR